MLEKYKRIQRRIYHITKKAGKGDLFSLIFDVAIIVLIILNVFAVVISTVDSVDKELGALLNIFEIVSVVVFSLEFILRVWVAPLNPAFRGSVKGRIRYFFSFYALVDLVSILPFYLPMITKVDLRFLRALRLFRIFRIFKVGRYSKSIRSLTNVFVAKKEQLLVTVFGAFILLIIVSSIMFYVENSVQPKAFSSIPATMWWGVATLTTVGYGDIYPITVVGKILGSLIALLGIGMFGLPAAILGSGFIEAFIERRASGMQSEIKDHIIICNWNSIGEKVIMQLHANEALPNTDIIVISEEIPNNENSLKKAYKEFKNVRFVQENPLKYETLTNYNVHTARSVIILSSPSALDSDANSSLLVVSIRNICQKYIQNEDDQLTIVVEAVEVDKLQHLKDAGANVVISSKEYGTGLLAQSAIFENLHDVFHQLLSYSKDTNEFYIIDNAYVMQWASGKSFYEISNFIVDINKNIPDEPLILVGYQRDGKVLLNPKDWKNIILEQSDSLVIMSYLKPDLERHIIEEMKRD